MKLYAIQRILITPLLFCYCYWNYVSPHWKTLDVIISRGRLNIDFNKVQVLRIKSIKCIIFTFNGVQGGSFQVTSLVETKYTTSRKCTSTQLLLDPYVVHRVCSVNCTVFYTMSQCTVHSIQCTRCIKYNGVQ